MPRNNKILIRSGTVAPTASDFAVGEPAFDKSAGKLYIKNDAGAMVDITGSGGGGGSVDVYAYASPANFPATGASAVIYLAMDTSRMYQWAGTVYVEMGPLSVGDTVSSAGSASSSSSSSSSSSLSSSSSSSSAGPEAIPMAVLLTSGTSYTVPAGATLMKAWAVGAGGSQGAGFGNAGAVAYKTWTVTGGSAVAYSLGANSTYYSRTNTTVTYDGTTISAQSGSGSDWNGTEAATYSGGDGGANGGLHGYPSGSGGSGGAVGGNSGPAACGRYTATDVSGLFAAVVLAGGSVTESCGATAAFGSGGTVNAGLRAGIGGGGAYFGGDQTTTPGGPSAIVLYFNAGGSANTGASSSSSSSSSSSAAGGGGGGGAALSITSQPLNDYAPNGSTSTSFSVTAAGGTGSYTYQWQYYGVSSNENDYNDAWRNISGATASTYSSTFSNFVSNVENNFNYIGSIPLRCVISDGSTSVTSDAVRFLELDLLHYPYVTWYGTGGTYPNYGTYQTMSPPSGEALLVDVMDYAMVSMDLSWYTGNDVTLKIQVATTGYTDSADWTDLHTQDFRGMFYLSGHTIAPSTGTKYYRVIAVDKWPRTVNNSTGSATKTSAYVYPHYSSDVIQITWPATNTFNSFNSAWTSVGFTGIGTAASPYTPANWSAVNTNIVPMQATVIASGTVRVTGQMYSDYDVNIYKNGTLAYTTGDSSGGGNGYTYTLNATISVTAGDVIRFGNASNGDYYTGAAGTPLSIWWQ